MRSYKKVGNVESTYQYVGDKLMYEKRGTTEFYYYYDSFGNLAGIKYYLDGTQYMVYAICNTRGDVEDLYWGSGNLACHYTYDSWGNVISITNADGQEITNPNAIGNLNPIRYRGYYYDTEIGMYYLQSRYYNPQVGRFLNVDGYVSTGQDINGCNMFAYCGNNPVNRMDSTGHSWIAALLVISVVVACAVGFSGCSAKQTPEPYQSADEAAKAFSEQVYSSSAYIRHEYGTDIYSRTIKGKTTYNYNPPRAGQPHSVNVGYPIPKGTKRVAYAHTHPNSNFFSGTDIQSAETLGVNAYVVGPNLELQRYNLSSATITNLGTISPITLTEAQRDSLITEFQVSWDTHVSSGCDFDCYNKIWPTP